MIETFLLTVWLGTGISYVPFVSSQACVVAIQSLDYRVAVRASCTVATAAPAGTRFAPEYSPVPRARPRVFKTNEWRLL